MNTNGTSLPEHAKCHHCGSVLGPVSCPKCGSEDTSPHKQGALVDGELVTLIRRQCHNPTCCHRWTSER